MTRLSLALKWLRWACSLLVGIELVYLAAANLFLNCNGLSWAFAGTNQVTASVVSGWSVVPGRVHVRQLRLTFQDHNLQFSIDVARAFLVVHLTELTRREFHGSHLRGEGVSFRMRHRVDPWSKHEPSVATFPPIPEFPAPAVFEATVPEPPIADAQYRLWTVHFDDVDVGVSELWAQAFRYRGRGRARGEFELKPARRLWVGPASLELEAGLLSAGAYRVAPELHGRIDCTVHPFDVRVPSGMQPFRWISARVRLESAAFDPQFYALFADESGPHVSSAGGTLALDVAIERGVFTPESRLRVLQRGFELRAAQGELNAEQLELRAGAQGDAAGLAQLVIERGTLKEPIAPGYPPRIEHLSFTLLSEHRDVARDFHVKQARLDEARCALSDASWLNRWLKNGSFSLAGGSASVVAHGSYADGLLAGEARLESDELRARWGGKHLRYAGAVNVRLERADLQRFTGTLSADLSGRSLRAEVGDGGLEVAGVQLHVSARRDDAGNALTGNAKLWSLSLVGGGFAASAPELVLAVRSEQAAGGAQLSHFQAEIPAIRVKGRGARLTCAASARGTLAQPKNKHEQRLSLWASLLRPRAVLGERSPKTAATERLALHAALTNDARGALSGRLELSPAAWRVDAGNLRWSGESALAADFEALDLKRHAGTVRARLTSNGVTLGDTTENADCPWSRVQLLELDGTARLLERGSAALTLTGELRRTELNWGDFLTRADVGIQAKFEPGLLTGEGEGEVELSFRDATLQSGVGDGKGWSARVPALGVQARLGRKAGKLSGTASLSALAARGRVGSTHLSTDLSADFELDTLDWAASNAHGSGAVHVRNAALPDGPDPISKWWADVKVDSIFGHAQQNLELAGTFRADLRDATPGLAVLASQGSLPKWLANAFPLRGLSVTGSLGRRCRLTDIHLVQLRGGPAVARGRLQSVPDGFQGALLFRLAGLEAISAGLDFDAQHTHFGMFSGDAWLSRFNEYFDRKSDDAVKLACPPDPDRCTDPAAPSGVTRAER